jgi:hypothetical protein
VDLLNEDKLVPIGKRAEEKRSILQEIGILRLINQPLNTFGRFHGDYLMRERGSTHAKTILADECFY